VLHELGVAVPEQHQGPDGQRAGRRGWRGRETDTRVPGPVVPDLVRRQRQLSGGHHRVQVGVPEAVAAVRRLRAAGLAGVPAAVARPIAHGRE